MNNLLIKNLKIIKWRNLSNISINFEPKINKISGANGSGKSSILDAIRYLIFQKDEYAKKMDNYRIIEQNNENCDYPALEMKLLFNDKPIFLQSHNNKWYINNILQANKDSYLLSLANMLSLKDINEIFVSVNPNLLSKAILGSGTSEDSQDIRNEILFIVNNMLPDKDRFNIQYLENMFNEIKNLEEKLKEKKSLKKAYLSQINEIKKNFPTITEISWNKNDELLVEITNKIQKREAANLELKKIKNKIELLENEINAIEIGKCTKHKSIVKIIFLTIITFGLYLFFYCKNKKNKTSNETTNAINIKKITKEINELKDKYNSILQSSDYRKNINELIDQREDLIKTQNDFNYKNIKFEFNKLINLVDNLQKEENEIVEKLKECKNQKIKLANLITNFLKNYFDDFEIDLFSNTGKEKIIIKQNNIDLKFLNFANKYKIIYKINEFLKNKHINTFSLIDQGESFNDLNLNSNNQIIYTIVSKENKINLNGKDIN